MLFPYEYIWFLTNETAMRAIKMTRNTFATIDSRKHAVMDHKLIGKTVENLKPVRTE